MPKENYFTPGNIDDKSKELLKRVAKLYRIPQISFDLKTSCLLVIDMQEYFLNKNSHAFLPSAMAIISKIKRLIKFFHKKKDR